MPRPKARGQLAVIRKLIKQATGVVHAGDPDRALLRFFYLKLLLGRKSKK